MKILDRLFSPPSPAEPPSLEQQVGALTGASADVLERTAQGDGDGRLRQAAIEQLADGPTLRRLAGLGDGSQDPAPSGTLRLAAEKRLAQLLDAGTPTVDAFLAEYADRPEALDVIALSADPEQLPRALERYARPEQLATLAVEGGSTRLRQLAATRLEDPEHLKPLLRRLRGKDRNVYRIVQQKCEVFIAEARRIEAAAHEAALVCAALERHATALFDAVYEATVEVHATRWQGLDPRPDAELERRATAAIARCRAVVESHREALAREAATLAEAQAAEVERAQRAEEAVEAERQAAIERAARAEADAQHEADAHAADLQAAEAQAERAEEAEQRHRRIGGLVRMANDALKAGNSRRAARFRLAIEEKLPTVPDLPPHIARTLQQLDDKLNELRHWKDYAAAPKRAEILEEMESLIGSDEEPAALAERIRSLQQEWRTLRKGLASESTDEMERFQRAHQAAFKPCQEYFAVQAALRRDNLEARRQVVERLRALTAQQQDEQADRRAITAALREAPREFWKPAPVERDAGRALHQEFDQLMEGLRAILNGWYDANAARRQGLVDEARALIDLEDPTRAIEGVRTLQARWKDSGPVVPRERDQALWTAFRECCDAVFRRREQAFADQAAALNATAAEAAALCAAVEAATESPPATPAERTQALAGWRNAFEALGDVPRDAGRALRDRFEKAVARYEARLADEGRRAEAASVENLFIAARHVRAWQQAAEAGDGDEAVQALRAAAEAFIASVTRWPKGTQAVLRRQLAQDPGAAATDATAREKFLRLLCIRAELLASIPSPAEDETLRREYQVERLMRGMGQGIQSDERDVEALLGEWIAAPAIEATRHDALEARFQQALARRPAPVRERAPPSPRVGRSDRDFRGPRGNRDERPARGDRRGGPPRDDRRR